jgi:hypothetical protein
MKRSILFLIAVNLCSGLLFGAVPGLTVKLPQGWTETASVSPITGKPDPATFGCVPKDDSNAEVLITIIGRAKGGPANADALVRLHKQTSRQYLSSDTQTYDVKDLPLEGGIAKYASFEDPDLKGKPVQKGEYKVATPVAILFADGTLAYATVLTDSMSDALYKQALVIVSSAKYAAPPRKDGAFVRKLESGGFQVGNDAFDAVLLINPKEEDFRKPPLGYGQSFTLVAESGLRLSGWLAPAASYEGVTKERWLGWRRMAELQNLEVRNEQQTHLGGWNVVTYTVEVAPQGIQSNLRAWRTLGETWFGVDLSATGQKDQTDKLKTILQSCEVKLK